jgi:ribonuclease HI
MGLTVFADASFCAQTGAAGWGAWAKADGWLVGKTFGGQFKTQQATNNTAELGACANALHVVLNHEAALGTGQVLLQSDNQRALTLLVRAGLAEASGWCPAKVKTSGGQE